MSLSVDCSTMLIYFKNNYREIEIILPLGKGFLINGTELMDSSFWQPCKEESFRNRGLELSFAFAFNGIRYRDRRARLS